MVQHGFSSTRIPKGEAVVVLDAGPNRSDDGLGVAELVDGHLDDVVCVAPSLALVHEAVEAGRIEVDQISQMPDDVAQS